MSAHTPGPWSWWTSCGFRRLSATFDGDVLHAVIQRSDGHPDIHFPNGGPEGPDARLIAVAPELLAMVRELDAWLAFRPDLTSREEHAKVKALIAKATGEQP